MQIEASLKNLIVLDLGENNISDLNYILQLLINSTPNLSALTLQGNPCSYLPHYFTETVTQLTKIEKLDNENVKDYQPVINGENLEAALVINCYRVMGVNEPRAETYEKKKVAHTFRVELECPLIDEGLRNWEEIRMKRKYKGLPEEEEITEEPTNKQIESNKKQSQRKPSQKSKASSKKDKKEPEPDLDEEVLREILANDKRSPGTSDIVSDAISWAKSMEYKEPAIKVLPPGENLILLRDTFRSQIILRVVHLKVLPVEKAANKKQKGKKGPPEENTPHDNSPKETIISRQVVARIPINLKSIKWNKEVLFYTWDKKTPHMAVEASNLKIWHFDGLFFDQRETFLLLQISVIKQRSNVREKNRAYVVVGRTSLPVFTLELIELQRVQFTH